MGVEHGAYCVGCCWGLMVILFALGVMSLLWMAAVAAVIFAQKVLPRADRLAIPFAVALVAVGVWLAAAPNRLPGLTRPGTAPSMDMAPAKPIEVRNGTAPKDKMAPAMQEMDPAK